MGYAIAAAVIITVILYASCWQSGTISRQEEEKYPCETCVRWTECNGVDEECPWRKRDGGNDNG